MSAKTKALSVWWIVPLLSVASLSAASSDLRLVDSVKNGDKEAVRSLLQQHADVNAPEVDGTTALAWAVHHDDLETADLLIRAGANVNAKNDYGATPLWLACRNGNAVMVEKLLKAGANPNAALWSGETALMAAADTGSVDAVKLLLTHGADPNAAENRGGQMALMWAVAGKHSEVARALIDHGADVHARSKGVFTPLLFAAQQGDLDSAQILWAAGAIVNEVTADGMSALLVASAGGHEALSVFLLDKGADPNATVDGKGFTALHYAASGLDLGRREQGTVITSSSMQKLVEALLAHGANPNARLGKDAPAVGGISTVGATPFLLAALRNNVSIMRILATNGADPQLALEYETTALILSGGGGAATGDGLNPNNYRKYTEEEERSALEAIKLVVELGADINNAANEVGQTALHAAAYTGLDTVIQFLVDKGAKMDVMDKWGQTPLSIASNVITVGLGDAFNAKPRAMRESSTTLLLKLGATPLAVSGVQVDQALLK